MLPIFPEEMRITGQKSEVRRRSRHGCLYRGKPQRPAAATELVDSIRSETRRVRARRVVTRHCHRGTYSARPCEYWRHFLDTCCAEDHIYHPRSIARDATDPTARCCAAGNDNW